ncbi:hypothetical protein OH76DRAFT_1487218 [Lentinus brumalis]|uniref:Uncharacterized protein n=1 Tax=Lentinus brumalis TaxID=2498619 RepID=A0A371CVG9_9APHY|nr:hypothetical protein OH76DRAFT_1487218 [Polyporus brumalis]
MHSTLLVKQSAVIAIYFDGARKYSAPAAIGMVSLADSAEVILCALAGRGSFPSLLSASLTTFCGAVKLDHVSLALISVRGVVCISFRDQSDMGDFLGAYESARASYESAHASANVSGDDPSARDGSPEPDESATFSLLASHLATIDGDWDFVDFTAP